MVNWAQVAAVGLGGLTDAFGANSAEKQRAEMMKRALRQLFGLQGEAGVAGQQQLLERQRALGDVTEGFDSALGEISNAGYAGETAARDAFVQGQGQDAQTLLSRGMYDPQALISAGRGRTSDLTRALMEVRERVGQARANLFQNRGMALGAARGDIATQIGQNFDRRYNIGTDIVSTQLSQTPTYQPQGANIGFLLGSLFKPSLSAPAARSYQDEPGFVGPKWNG